MAFCRFIFHLGPVEQMHSNCDTNFVGAEKFLQPVDQFTQSEDYQIKCKTYLTTRNVSWHFNPPSASHFRGLWEAGVKSVKTLLYRTFGHQQLTYEELTNLLIRIEATFNSRPLGALSFDSRDFEALTPSNCLTLISSTSNVEPNLNILLSDNGGLLKTSTPIFGNVDKMSTSRRCIREQMGNSRRQPQIRCLSSNPRTNRSTVLEIGTYHTITSRSRWYCSSCKNPNGNWYS